MRQTIVATILILATVGSTGCRIQNDKHGDSNNVRIATPLGGMQVKTNNADILAGIGLPAYPGATVVTHERRDGKDHDGSADVNMSFGSFQLKVKAIEYRTIDSPQRVLTFYKQALGRFGTVIQCDGDHPVGTPLRTDEGLTCDDNGHEKSDHSDDKDAKLSLKAGSRKHQHLVEIHPEASGTRFGLVSLDLPLDFHFGDDGNKGDDHKQ